MTFLSRYESERRWQERAGIMALYHHARKAINDTWTLQQTADYFNCSIGLVSENILLTSRIDELRDCLTRSEALLKIGRK